MRAPQRCGLAACFGVLLALGCFACTPSKTDQTPPVPPKSQAEELTGTLDPKKLVFGFTPYLPAEQLRQEFEPLVKHIGSELGKKVELNIAQDYGQLAELMANGKVHIGQLSPFNYVKVKERIKNLTLLGTHIADGSSTYSAYIVVRDDSEHTAIQTLKGKAFAFVDEQSTSGYLYPLAYLRNMGAEPDTFFSKTVFAGNHGKVIEMILAGDADAGATYSTAYKMANRAPTEAPLRILAKTGRIPFDAYCAIPTLDAGLVAKVQEILLSLDTRQEVGRRLLAGLTNINGFVRVGDEHYDEVRRVAQLVQQTRPASP